MSDVGHFDGGFTFDEGDTFDAPIAIYRPPPPPPLPPWPPEPLHERLWLEMGERTRKDLVGYGGIPGIPTGPVMDLDATEGNLLRITEVDYGFPEIREQVEPRPAAHGVIDKTRWYGNRVVTLTGKLDIDWQSRGRRQTIVDRLAPFLMPGERPFLYSRFDDGRVRRLQIRADQFSKPQIANIQDITFSFKTPGFFEDEEVEVLVLPEQEVSGRTYAPLNPNGTAGTPTASTTRRYPRVYPAGYSYDTIIDNRGQVPADWRARIFGPVDGPAIELVNTGEMVDLAGFAGTDRIPDGEFVEVDSREHTVFYQGEPQASRWHLVDFANTTWWQLPAGESHVRLHTHWFQAPNAKMLFYYRATHVI